VPLRRDHDSVHRDIQLHLAAQYGYTEAVKSLLEEDKNDVDQSKIDGSAALQVAAEHGYAEIVRLLIETGKVDVNRQTRKDTARST
jgi:ankyrin repeat protein